MSVVIPVKDDGVELERVLQDLAAQTVAPDEVIVVDNASTEDIASIARRAGARVVFEAAPGIPAAASAGYDAAASPIIARCDADSRLPRDWIERIEHRIGRGDVAAVTGPGDFYSDADVERDGRVLRLLSNVYMSSYRWGMHAALGNPPLFGSNCAFRADVWRAVRSRVHRTGDDIHDDIDLSVHLGRRHLVAWDRDLRVGISSRPLDRGARRLRVARGWRSLSLHWPHESPLLRWRRRIKWRGEFRAEPALRRR
ncbi:glycosyltransferase family 2 protein [Amnibacterium flavum]|uniref:glycosyltransferase family 2 protein n=1 Tax=Amnibacterium flavum TaxID=2173173 RepID=UPI001F0C5454|nr:glycosyltransferase family 2 protein [Amnibacterium flavum]